MPDKLSQRPKVVLAEEKAFTLGSLVINPAQLKIEQDGEAQTVGARLMQVLVVLGRPSERVVSRDELVERGWDGRAIGESAIQRVISRIRQIGSDSGAFEMETVPGAGYRLRLSSVPHTEEQQPPPAALAPSTDTVVSRRGALWGIATLGLVAGGGVAWRIIGRDNDQKAARLLAEQGREAQFAGLKEQDEQSIAYLEQATELDPDFPAAWGLLALGYQSLMTDSPSERLTTLATGARRAAKRALELDPGNVDAKVALATIQPSFRHWAENEENLRRILAQHGSREPAEAALGGLLCDVGRWNDAVGCFRRALALEPLHPGNQTRLAVGLWGQGRLAEAGRILQNAAKQWPQHRGIWQARFEFLATTGRPAAALALINNSAARPLIAPGDEPPPYEALGAFARALQTGTAANVARAIGTIGTPEAPGPLGHHPMYLMVFGRLDEVFDWLEYYFFGSAYGGAPAPLARRKTGFLFSANARPLWGRVRYEQLIRKLGLDDYWRATATGPDFSR